MFCCFFFQAEDGIRDLVRSRGLGDVYKRQDVGIRLEHAHLPHAALGDPARGHVRHTAVLKLDAVSYTHLTLPTSDLV